MGAVWKESLCDCERQRGVCVVRERERWVRFGQCDQMAWLFVQYLSIHQIAKEGSKFCQVLNLASKNSQRRFKILPNTKLNLQKLPNTFKISSNLVTLVQEYPITCLSRRRPVKSHWALSASFKHKKWKRCTPSPPACGPRWGRPCLLPPVVFIMPVAAKSVWPKKSPNVYKSWL